MTASDLVRGLSRFPVAADGGLKHDDMAAPFPHCCVPCHRCRKHVARRQGASTVGAGAVRWSNYVAHSSIRSLGHLFEFWICRQTNNRGFDFAGTHRAAVTARIVKPGVRSIRRRDSVVSRARGR